MSSTDRREFLHSAAGLAAAAAIVPSAAELEAVWRPRRAIDVAVIGGGRQGRDILAELAKIEGVNVAAVCELDKRRLRRALRRTTGAKGYSEWNKMLAAHAGVTAVFVATPTHLHKDVVIGLLRAGKHVYCEAPMASTIDDAKAIAKAGLSAKTTFQVGHYARANPVYKLARSFYRSGSIETLISARCQWHRKTTWRLATSDASREKVLNWRLYQATSSGLPGEFGSHWFDAIRWFTRKTPVSVRGVGSTMLHNDGREIPDTVLCQFDFGEGVSMLFDATLANSFGSRHALLNGTMGTIKLAGRHGWLFKEADAPVQGWEVYANRQQFHDESGITLIADATQLAAQGRLKDGVGLPHPELHYSLERFLQSATEGKPVCCTALDGLYAAAVSIKAHEAVLANAEIKIDPSLFKV
ncbi:MAG: hypothetical protein CMJ83_10255 [Planctomycetes bacterium]|nr:hypothetical protein [Planctomycetota bacterium]